MAQSRTWATQLVNGGPGFGGGIGEVGEVVDAVGVSDSEEDAGWAVRKLQAEAAFAARTFPSIYPTSPIEIGIETCNSI